MPTLARNNRLTLRAILAAVAITVTGALLLPGPAWAFQDEAPAGGEVEAPAEATSTDQASGTTEEAAEGRMMRPRHEWDHTRGPKEHRSSVSMVAAIAVLIVLGLVAMFLDSLIDYFMKG